MQGPGQNLKLRALTLAFLKMVGAGALLAGCLEGGHTVVEPRGGEEWAVGTTHDIRWVSFGISEVHIEISRDGGAAWETIAGSTEAAYGVYTWAVTGPASDDCVVRVSDAADQSLSATSEGRFSIRAKEISIRVPSGGETWCYRGADRLITWTSFGVIGNVDLLYSTDAAQSWAGIDEAPNTGSYLWTIPNENSTRCRVKVQEKGGAAAAESADFTICPVPGAAFTDTGDLLTGVDESALAWGDYDSDGRLDLIVTGDTSGSDDPVTTLYHNEGAGGLVAFASGIVNVESGDVAWGDFDGDGDIDLAIAGSTDGTSENVVTKVYCNEGGAFTDIGAGLTGVASCALRWGDCDNDGDLDLAVAGLSASGPLSRIYQNTGDGVQVSFELYGAQLADVSRCALRWGDYDNDGDLDLALAGEDASGDCVAKIYRNTKDDLVDSGIYVIGVKDCSLAWGDYDNDGDLDLAVAGYSGVAGRVGRVYDNQGGTFTDLGLALVRVDECSLRWGDYDNDGDLDLAIAGLSGTGCVARVYRNDGEGRFTDAEAGLVPAGRGSLAWGDYDSDGDLDLAVAGYDDIRGRTTLVYRNLSSTPNSPPSLPGGLETVVDEVRGIVTFSWAPAVDAETAQPGLTYNLTVWNEEETHLYVPGMAHEVTGARLVPAMGNMGHNTTYVIGWLLPGHYTWSVQAVDSGLTASEWPTPAPPAELDADFDCGAMFANATPRWEPDDDGGYPAQGMAAGACASSGGRSGVDGLLFFLGTVLLARACAPKGALRSVAMPSRIRRGLR